jgi:outer membrane receptor for ferrienterochelin and colicins
MLFANIARVTVLLIPAMLSSAGLASAGQDPQPKPQDYGDKSIEELMTVKVESVYGAAKHQQRVTDAPSSVTVITADDITTFGWRTLGDVLKNVRGFYVTNDRNYWYVGARGFGRPSDYNNRILLLVNGHRFNDNVYDGAYVGTEFGLGVDLIDRIEIIRGPGSALYGTSAFFAVINMITRRTVGKTPTEVSAEIGTLGSYGGRVTTGWTRNGFDALFSVAGTTTHGVSDLYFPAYDAPSTNHGIAHDVDGDRSASIFGSVTVRDVTIEGLFSSREKYLPTGSFEATFNDPRNRTTDERGWIDVSRRFTVAGTDLTARGSYDHMGYDGTYIYDEGETVNRDFAHGDWLSGELVASRSLGGRNVFTGGVEYRRNVHQDQWAYDEPTPEDRIVDAQYDSHQWGVYGQAEIALHPRVMATVGGRYDRWSLIGGAGRPRLGLVITPAANTAIKVLYGGAYRAPNLFELFYYGGPGVGDPDRLKPESLKTAEGVFEQYIGGRLRVTGTLFTTTISQLITQTLASDGSIVFNNRDRVRARGAEVEAEARWPNGILVRGSYSYQRVRDDETGEELVNAPRTLGVINVAVPVIGRGLTLATDAGYVGRRFTLSGQTVDGVWVTNMNAVLRPRGSRLTVSAGIMNLFDRRYGNPVGAEFKQDLIEQNGRTAMAKLTVRF